MFVVLLLKNPAKSVDNTLENSSNDGKRFFLENFEKRVDKLGNTWYNKYRK